MSVFNRHRRLQVTPGSPAVPRQSAIVMGRRLRVSALLLALALAGTACSAVAGSQPTELRIQMAEYKLTPNQLTIDSGIYSFTAVNGGTINHALELIGSGVDVHTPDLAFAPGHSEAFTVTLKPGTYHVFCPIDGHRGLGMQATLLVR